MNWSLPAIDTYFRRMLDRDPRGFEIDHLEEALKHCKNFRIAVDGGAHVGTWSAQLSKRFQKVIAFEPADDTYECLVKNLEGFKNVECLHYALGERHNVGSLVDDPTRVGNTGARYVQTEGWLGQVTSVWTIDMLNLGTVDFIKLDVEGSELLALRGAIGTITRCHPTIMVELKEFSPRRNGGTVLVRRWLTEIGYYEVGGIRNDRVFVSSQR